ncbi:hypothetical protein HK097_011650 [Rhizophlyctis rosea]|uniref:Uncharacterized protein n=1 Tax=Rhizophlyctis rosea TaxID=64517 RepID=A0AAD5S8S6_9FUNG|nr:hypothetical protein HK097_011650 [Rhizophlyctis rosea]
MPISQYHSTTSVSVSISMSMEMSMSVSSSTSSSSPHPTYPQNYPSVSTTPLLQTPSKKRCRDYVVEEDLVAERAKKVASRGNGMEVDEEEKPAVRWRSFTDLSSKELGVARTIAIEKISQTLLLDPVLPDDTGTSVGLLGSTPPTPSPSPGPRALMTPGTYAVAVQETEDAEWDEQSSLPSDVQMGAFSREQGDDPFTFGTSPSPTSTPIRTHYRTAETCILTKGLKIPTIIHTIATFIAQHAHSVLGVFSKHGDPERLHCLGEALRCLDPEHFLGMLRSEDAVELGVLLKERVLACGGLLGAENLEVWRSM